MVAEYHDSDRNRNQTKPSMVYVEETSVEDLLRIAVCQLTCHPSIYTHDIDYVSEPFVPPINGPSLTVLASEFECLRVRQQEILRKYLEWHEARLDAIFQY